MFFLNEITKYPFFFSAKCVALYELITASLFHDLSFKIRVIYIVRTHKREGEGFFLGYKISKLFFFSTKEAITLPFIICV